VPKPFTNMSRRLARQTGYSNWSATEQRVSALARRFADVLH